MSSHTKQTADSGGDSAAGFAVQCQVHFKKGRRGRKIMKKGKGPLPPPAEPGRIPRVSRLMALAIHFEGLIKRGAVRDYAVSPAWGL